MFFKYTFVYFFLIAFVILSVESETKNKSPLKIPGDTKKSCGKDEFKCKNQRCVPATKLCNSVNDCGDKSDESAENCGIFRTGSCEKENQEVNCSEGNTFSNATTNVAHSFLCPRKQTRNNESSIILRCKSKIWTPIKPNCMRLCQKVSFSAASVDCYRNNVQQNCTAPLFSGTKIKARCPPYYKPTFDEITCDMTGKWDHNWVECVPSCGQRSSNKTITYSRNARPAEKREFPWNVALYTEDKSVPLCPATLISPRLLLTAAICVQKPENKSILMPEKDFEIIFPKSRRETSKRDDELQKSYGVRNIFLPDDAGKNSTDNVGVVLLELNEKLNFSSAVYPICLNWDKKQELNPSDGTQGQVLTWRIRFENGTSGRTSTLAKIAMTYFSYASCLKKIPQNKNVTFTQSQFCVETDKSTVYPHQAGSGWNYVEKNTSSFFLGGLLNNDHRQNRALKNVDPVSFVDLNHPQYIDWINEIRKRVDGEDLREISLDSERGYTADIDCKSSLSADSSAINAIDTKIFVTSSEKPTTIISSTEKILLKNADGSEGCVLVDVAYLNASNYVLDCELIRDKCRNIAEDSIVSIVNKLSITCKPGYTLQSNESAECVDNTWKNFPMCIRICAPLTIPENTKAECSRDNDKVVDCGGMLKAGTRVVAKCYDNYEPKNMTYPTEIRCQSDGKWDGSLMHCVPSFENPTCGVPVSQSSSLSTTKERNVFNGELPWHAAIYDVGNNNNTEVVCGGTVISPHLILSAARCFVDDVSDAKRKPQDFKIGVGRLASDYSSTNDERGKIYDVENVIYNDFIGKKRKYKSDIALVVTRDKIKFNPFVRPVCLSSGVKEVVVTSNTTLKVASWGLDRKLRANTMLKVIEVPLVSNNDCMRLGPADLLDFLTDDRFCSGDINGADQDVGDGGTGLVYEDERTSQYYLYGILSMKSRNVPSVGLFTNVQFYRNWVLKTMEEVNRMKSH